MPKPLTHKIWVEKYRPQSIDELICSDDIKKSLETTQPQHMIFHGKAGSGKTTAARILMNTIDCDSLYLNAGDENGIDTVRGKILDFASTASFKPLKLVVLDDCQNLSPQAQQALLNIIETYSKTTRFIFTCNAVEKLIPPLRSRCQELKFIPPSKKEVAGHVAEILDNEEIQWEPEILVSIINKFFPDIRKIVNVTQANCNDGVLQKSKVSNCYDYIDKIISALTSKDKEQEKFLTVRQITADNGITDFQEIYTSLYEKAPQWAPNSLIEVCIYLGEGLYESNFVPDREITWMKTAGKIIQALK